MSLEEISAEMNRRRKITPEGEVFEPMFTKQEIEDIEASLRHIRTEMIPKLAVECKATAEEVDACLPRIPTQAEFLKIYENKLRQKAIEGGFRTGMEESK